jgi:UDP-N-acetylmuramyl pentapeptide phosphotransferase/UDP-N-acetylglucosamine-1-phosphate transferase
VKAASMIGILLIVLGVIALTYQGITYTTQKKVVDVGPIHATKDEHKTIPLPPVLGGMALVAGVALLMVGGKDT